MNIIKENSIHNLNKLNEIANFFKYFLKLKISNLFYHYKFKNVKIKI